MFRLTYEEECLLACFEGISRNEVIADVKSKLPYLDEEMLEFTQQTLQKLEDMTDIEFKNIRGGVRESSE